MNDKEIAKDIRLTKNQASDVICQWLGKRIWCRDIQPLEGGICSAVYRLDFDAPPYSAVVKLQDVSADDPLPRESLRLDFLHKNTHMPCPEVYLQDNSGTTIPYSFLLLERIPGMNLEAAELAPEQRTIIERELAEVLIDLHSHKRSTFGNLHEETGMTSWAEHFLPDLEECREDMDAFLSIGVLRQLDEALILAQDAFQDQGEPTLIHHDIWGGNIIVDQRNGEWRLSGIIDPVGLQYADVEKELAYIEAFDTAGDAFFDVYTAHQPLRPGYHYRKLFYNLHTYMIHVWLGFGPMYCEKVAETSRKILQYSETR